MLCVLSIPRAKMEFVPNTTRLANDKDGPRSYPCLNTDKLKKIVLGFWSNLTNDFFPAPQPVSMARRDFFRFYKFPYKACVKSDGMRFLMFCTVHKGKNKCFMIDRAFRFYEIRQNFEPTIYQNTLFDGELVRLKQSRKWVYVIHDCIVFQKKNVREDTFSQRYKYVEHTLAQLWHPEFSDQGRELASEDDLKRKKLVKYTMDTVPLKSKNFFEFEELQLLHLEIENQNIDHKIDGLVFIPVNEPVGTRTQRELLKWKPREQHTFDFKIVTDNDNIVAYVSEKNQPVVFAAVQKSTEQGKEFFNKLKSLGFKEGDIVECEFQTNTQYFFPVCIRKDKSHPNGLYTVEKTIKNIEENITIQDLLRLSDRVHEKKDQLKQQQQPRSVQKKSSSPKPRTKRVRKSKSKQKQKPKKEHEKTKSEKDTPKLSNEAFQLGLEQLKLNIQNAIKNE